MLRTTYAALAIGLFACGRSSQPSVSGGTEHVPSVGAPLAVASSTAAAPKAPAVRTITLAEAGLDPAWGDPAADPCTDFYRYACGGYATKAPPAGAARWDRSDDLRATLEARVLELVGSDAPEARPIAAYYRACTSEQARARIGLVALQPLRDAIDAIKDRSTLSTALGTLHAHGVRAALSLTAAPDFRAGGTTILHLDSGGLTLGDRAYYLDAKEPLGGGDNAALRRAYENAVAALFEAAGESGSAARSAARDVLALETQLARAARSSYERRTAPLLHDRIDLEGLAEQAPQLDWTAYFAALGGDAPAISTTSRAYVHRVGVLSKSVRAGMWQHYLRWRLLYTFAFDGPAELAAARRAVDGLGGEPAASLGLVTGCARATIDALPALVSSQVVGAPVRDRTTAITSALADAVARGAAESTWMAESTRARAVAKIGAMQRTVAGTAPDAPPTIGAGHLANAVAMRRAATALALGAARTGTDAWSNPAHTGVTYQWLGNVLRLPAGVLALPIVSTERPIALDLGALSALAGHELAHAIDERGADWTERGDLGNWWQAADDAAFAKTSACFVARARAAKLDAPAVIGEARADAIGIAAGLRALPAVRAAAPPQYRIADLSDEQLYFLGAATALCAREPASPGGNRPPARYRVNATFANLPAFGDVWSCPANTPMRAATPCTP